MRVRYAWQSEPCASIHICDCGWLKKHLAECILGAEVRAPRNGEYCGGIAHRLHIALKSGDSGDKWKADRPCRTPLRADTALIDNADIRGYDIAAEPK